MTFEELQKFWEMKLMESGFEDAEKTINGKRVLKKTATGIFVEKKVPLFGEKISYFEAIAENIASTNFETLIDELIMRKYADGRSINRIVSEIKALKISVCRGTVRFTVRRFEHLWGIKRWTGKDRRLKSG